MDGQHGAVLSMTITMEDLELEDCVKYLSGAMVLSNEPNQILQ